MPDLYEGAMEYQKIGILRRNGQKQKATCPAVCCTASQVTCGGASSGGVLVLILLLLICSTGCMRVGPDYVRPEIAIEPQWLAARDAKVFSDEEIPLEWWKQFGDPLLETLVEKVRKDNLQLQVAGLRIYQARAQLASVVGGFYPNQQLQGSYQWTHPSDLASTAPQPGSGMHNHDILTSSAGLSASWEPDFWGKQARQTEAAAATLHATISEYHAAMASFTAEVASTYISYRTLQQEYAFAKANVEIQRENLRIATTRFNLGATSDRDVQQARAQLTSTEGSLPSLRSSLTKTGNALCTLLGLPPRDLEKLFGYGSIPRATGEVAVGIPSDLLRRRPDVRTAELQAMAACAQVGATKAELFPAFTIGGFVGFSASNVGAFTLGDMFGQGYTANGAPSVSLPFFNYGRITNSVRANDAAYQQALVLYRNTVISALADAENSLDAFLHSRMQVTSYEQSSRAAKKSLSLALIQYRDGATDFTTVLTAAATLADSQRTLAQAYGGVGKGLVSLYRALGGGWQQQTPMKPVPDAMLIQMRERTSWGRVLDDPEGFPPEEAGIHVPDF